MYHILHVLSVQKFHVSIMKKTHHNNKCQTITITSISHKYGVLRTSSRGTSILLYICFHSYFYVFKNIFWNPEKIRTFFMVYSPILFYTRAFFFYCGNEYARDAYYPLCPRWELKCSLYPKIVRILSHAVST